MLFQEYIGIVSVTSQYYWNFSVIFHNCLTVVSELFEHGLRNVSVMIEHCLRNVSLMIEHRLRNVSLMIEHCLRNVSVLSQQYVYMHCQHCLSNYQLYKNRLSNVPALFQIANLNSTL